MEATTTATLVKVDGMRLHLRGDDLRHAAGLIDMGLSPDGRVYRITSVSDGGDGDVTAIATEATYERLHREMNHRRQHHGPHGKCLGLRQDHSW